MNKITLLGRLTRDPKVRYSQSSNPIAVARYGIAVRRPRAKQNEPDVDFFNIVAFGKAGEFAEKYFKKGQQVVVVGHVQTGYYEDQQKVKHNTFDIIVEEQYFADTKSNSNNTQNVPISDNKETNFAEDELPF